MAGKKLTEEEKIKLSNLQSYIKSNKKQIRVNQNLNEIVQDGDYVVFITSHDECNIFSSIVPASNEKEYEAILKYTPSFLMRVIKLNPIEQIKEVKKYEPVNFKEVIK